MKEYKWNGITSHLAKMVLIKIYSKSQLFYSYFFFPAKQKKPEDMHVTFIMFLNGTCLNFLIILVYREFGIFMTQT